MGNCNHDEVGGYQLLKREVETLKHENDNLKKELANKTSQISRLETEVSTLKVFNFELYFIIAFIVEFSYQCEQELGIHFYESIMLIVIWMIINKFDVHICTHFNVYTTKYSSTNRKHYY